MGMMVSSDDSEDDVIGTINTTPLVDIMLVLLIIFLITGPVGEALIMTAIGLAVAVPAVLGYNWLTRRNKAVMENVRTFGSDLHTVLLSGEISTNPNHKKVVNK